MESHGNTKIKETFSKDKFNYETLVYSAIEEDDTNTAIENLKLIENDKSFYTLFYKFCPILMSKETKKFCELLKNKIKKTHLKNF